MRVVLVASLLVLPFAAGAATSDVRDVAANLVLDPRCPGQAQPAEIACFDAPAGATRVRVAVDGLGPGPGNAQPRMLVQLQNETVQWGVRWLCDDALVDWGAANVTRVVVTLHDDRSSCFDERPSLVLAGSVAARFP